MQYVIKDVCFFDTETTGVPAKGLYWEKDCDQFPYVAQLAWLKDGVLKSYIIKPIGADGKPYERYPKQRQRYTVSVQNEQ